MTKTEITIDKLPKDVLDANIDIMIASNPRIRMTRGDWIEFIKIGYDIKTIKTDIATHYILEPKELSEI